MANKELVIGVLADFNWQMILDYLSRETKEVMYQILEERVRRLFKIENELILCEITYQQHQQNLKIVRLDKEVLTEKARVVIEEFVSEWFDVSASLTEFYELAAKDEILSGVVKQFRGLRLVGIPDFFEAITWGILGQQINLSYTYTLKRRFTETFGEHMTYDNHVYWIYPTATKIAEVSLADLVPLKMTHKKCEYLIDISRRIASGEISKEYYLNFTSVANAEKAMLELRGIGPWTANYVLMRCLRRGEAFPMADIGLLNGIKAIKGLTEKPDIVYLKELKIRWGQWSSYATFYIWRLLY